MYATTAETAGTDGEGITRKGWNSLFHYRWRGIPRLLRSITGLAAERDIETLLDNAGYTASFIAEELIHLIDGCFTSGEFSNELADGIRRGYEALEAIAERAESTAGEPVGRYAANRIEFQLPAPCAV